MIFETVLTYYLMFTKPTINKNTVDLRPFFTEVFNQGKTNTCTANAITAVINYHEKIHNKKAKLISRLDLYHQSRKDATKDNGANIEKCMQVVENKGLCDENLWPYYWRNVNSNPPKKCIIHRKIHSELKPFKIPCNSECIG